MPKRTVAIAGINGKLGRPVIDAITTLFPHEYNFPIHALSRERFENNEYITFHQVDWQDSITLEEALHGCDTIVDLSGKTTNSRPLIDAAINAGARVYFTSEYRVDYIEGENDELFQQKESNYEYAMAQDFERVVQIVPGFFMEWVVPNLYLVGIHGDKYSKVDDGRYKLSMTTTDNVAKSVASLAYRIPRQLPEVIRIQGDTLTCDEIAGIYSEITDQRLINDPELRIIENENVIDPLRSWLTHPLQPFDMTNRTQNEVVNPGIWEWTNFRQVAEKLLLS